eukprot:g2205.t1
MKVIEYDFQEELRKRGIDPQKVQNLFEDVKMKQKYGFSSTYPYTILQKLMIFGVGVGRIDAFIYLDADMLLNESLDPLLEGDGLGWNGAKLHSPMDGEIHMATDTLILSRSRKIDILLSKNNFQSALILFKPSDILIDACFESLQSLVDRKYGWLSETVRGDQDVINVMLWHNSKIRAVRLDHSYNVYAHVAEPLLKHGVISKERVTQFATGHKPWQVLQNPGATGKRHLHSYGHLARVLRWFSLYTEFSISTAFTNVPENQHFRVLEHEAQTFFSRRDDSMKVLKSPNNYDGFEKNDVSHGMNSLSAEQLESQIVSRIQGTPLPFPESQYIKEDRKCIRK